MAQEGYYEAGFNAGYVLHELCPELTELFSRISTEDEYMKGMQDGRHENMLGRVVEQEQEDLKELNDLRSEQEPEQEQDR